MATISTESIGSDSGAHTLGEENALTLGNNSHTLGSYLKALRIKDTSIVSLNNMYISLIDKFCNIKLILQIYIYISV